MIQTFGKKRRMIAPKNFREIEVTEALHAMADRDSLTTNDVFTWLQERGSTISRPTCSIMLARLADRGIVLREPIPDQGNKCSHRLTEKMEHPAIFAIKRTLEKHFVTKEVKISFLKQAMSVIMSED